MRREDTPSRPPAADSNADHSKEVRVRVAENSTMSRLDESRQDFLIRLHFPIQRLVVFVFGPLVFGIFGAFAWIKSCLLGWVVFGGAVTMNLCWIVALRLFKKGLVYPSVYLFMGAVLFFATTVGLLTSGLLPVVVLANIGVTVYGTLFSKRHMYAGGVATTASFVGCELAHYFNPFGAMVFGGTERLTIALIFGNVLVPVIALFLRRSQQINDELFDTKEAQNEEQAAIIETIHTIQPILSQAVSTIREVSNQFVAQASQQAAAAAEINTTVAEVSMTAESTAQTATNTQQIARRTREESLVSSARLQEVEKGFKQVVGLIEGAREEVNELATTVSRIEEILGFNLEIGQQIKILAINAGIQAAKAGRRGVGFRVIASSLREMIHDTDENLSSSRKLLEEIRVRTQGSSEKIEKGSGRLTRYFKELRTTGALIERSSENLIRTTEQVTKIAQAAREQRVAVSGVSTAMSQIDSAAAELSRSTSVLLESVNKIVGSQQSLHVALKAENS